MFHQIKIATGLHTFREVISQNFFAHSLSNSILTIGHHAGSFQIVAFLKFSQSSQLNFH